jgi:hypothetical protein
MFTLYSADNSKLMEIEALERSGQLHRRGVGAMLRRPLTLAEAQVLKPQFLLTFLLR